MSDEVPSNALGSMAKDLLTIDSTIAFVLMGALMDQGLLKPHDLQKWLNVARQMMPEESNTDAVKKFMGTLENMIQGANPHNPTAQ